MLHMDAYDFLTATALRLEAMTDEQIAGARLRLQSLVSLGLADVCGLSLAAGIDRLNVETARRVAYAAGHAAHAARHGGDYTAALLCDVLDIEPCRRERETVWCEAHGDAPHFVQSDCIYPHYTDQATRARMNAAD